MRGRPPPGSIREGVTRLTFYFDFISPYAYLGWTQIHALAQAEGVTVVPEPVLFAGFLNHHGQLGPAEIEAKRVWVGKECVRRAALLGVPFQAPVAHPFNPLRALRAVHAVRPELRRPFIDALFRRVWGDGPRSGGLDEPGVVADAAREAGLDADVVLERAGHEAIKRALRDGTDAAIASGVFGVPTVRVGDELFWGVDSFDLLRLHLRGQDPLDDAAFSAFLALRPSANRR